MKPIRSRFDLWKLNSAFFSHYTISLSLNPPPFYPFLFLQVLYFTLSLSLSLPISLYIFLSQSLFASLSLPSPFLILSFSYSSYLSNSFFPSTFLFLCLSFFLSASFSTFHRLSILHPHSQHQSHKEVQRCDHFKKYSPFQKNSEHKAEIFPTKSYQ